MSGEEVEVFCTTLTPFHEDGSIDEDALRVHLRRLVAARTSLTLAIGGASEAHALTKQEMRRIFDIGVEEAKGKVRINAGLRESRTAAQLVELAKEAAAAGVDAIQLYQLDNGHGMIPTPREQEAYWEEILSQINHPVILSLHYEFKFKPSSRLLQDLCARYKQILGFHANGSPQRYFIELRDLFPRPMRIIVGVPEFVQYVTLGASGYINPLANIIPYIGRSIVDAWMAGDFRQLSQSNLAAQRFLGIVDQWAPSTARWLKMAMKVKGLGNGVLRLPYLLPPDEELQKMADQFKAMRLDELEAQAKAYVEAHA